MTNGAHPIGSPKRVFPATFAHLQPTGPTVSTAIDDTSQFDSASSARPFRIRTCAIEIRGRLQSTLPA